MPAYDEQIKEIEDEIRNTQYNKATQHHIGLLKAKIARIREKKSSGGGGKKGEGYGVRKTGDSTVVLVGFPSVGKSTILNKLTNAESKIAAYAFTTLTVVPGVMEYMHAKIQILDVPGLIKGAASGTGMGKGVLSVIRSANLILLVTDPYTLPQIEVLKKELHNAGIRLNQKQPDVKIKRKEKGGVDVASTVKLTKLDGTTIAGILREFSMDNAAVVVREDVSADQIIDVVQGNRVYVPAIVIVNKADVADSKQRAVIRKIFPDAFLTSAEKDNPERIKQLIFGKLGIMRIFLKQHGKKADMKVPLIVKNGSTIGEVCERLHKEFLRKFKNAKVWGKSAKFPGQTFSAGHELVDRDVVQINLK